jgi:nitrite reductase (NADH) small subunit
MPTLQSEISNPQSTIHLCSLSDLPLDIGKPFRIANLTIAVFKTRSGNLIAIENTCPHRAGQLSDAILAGRNIVCPQHAFRYDLTTGQCDQPQTCPLKTYKVFTEKNEVYLTLPT